MLNSYYTIKEDGSNEIIIKKSRFICDLKRVTTEEEAQAFIQQIKKTHYKANHHCFAYVLATTPQTLRFSDDGEPSGTAGPPMLDILQKKELINLVAVVTRYFGGTKLGTGGLVRAYSGSLQEGLAAIGIVKGELYQGCQLVLDYAQQGNLDYFLTTHPQYLLTETTYTDKVTMIIQVKVHEVPQFTAEITELLQGSIPVAALDTRYVEVPIDERL